MGFFDLKLLIDPKYLKWIDTNYPTPESARTQCAEATEAMVKEFPELKRIRGVALVKEPWGLPPTKAPHWWCEDPTGLTIDPTAHQFPTEILDYEPLDESKGDPTGKCPNCGGFSYNNDYLCTKVCEAEYMAYLNGGD